MAFKDLYEKAVLKLGDKGYSFASNSKTYKSLDRIRRAVEFEKASEEFTKKRDEYRISVISRLNPGHKSSNIRKNLEILLLDEPVSFSNVRSKVCYNGSGEGEVIFYYDEEGIIQDFAKNNPSLSQDYNSGALILSGPDLQDKDDQKPFMKGWKPHFYIDNEIAKDPSNIKTQIINKSIENSSYVLDQTVYYFNRICKILSQGDWNYFEFENKFNEEYESRKKGRV